MLHHPKSVGMQREVQRDSDIWTDWPPLHVIRRGSGFSVPMQLFKQAGPNGIRLLEPVFGASMTNTSHSLGKYFDIFAKVSALKACHRWLASEGDLLYRIFLSVLASCSEDSECRDSAP